MSCFSGKCDFYDDMYMIGKVEEYIAPTTTIYVGNARIDNSKEENLIPYATNIVSSGCYSKESKNITLMEDSWIDMEERESLAWRIRDTIIYLSKHKKASIDKVAEEMAKIDFSKSEESLKLWKEIAKIVKDKNLVSLRPLMTADNNFIRVAVIPYYFYDVHLELYNTMRKRFLEFAESKGADMSNPILFKMKMALV